MNSNEIKFNAEGYNEVADSVLETRNQNNFNGVLLNPGDVITFPDDVIKPYSAPIRKWPNADDHALAEKNKAKVDELETKGEENWSEAEAAWYEKNKDKVTPKACIPIAYYVLGHKAGTTDGMLVNISYFSRVGRRTPAGKYESVDGLSKFLGRAGNATLQKEMLKGKTIKVLDEKSNWYMREFGGNADDVELRSIIIVDVEGEPSVDQPKIEAA